MQIACLTGEPKLEAFGQRHILAAPAKPLPPDPQPRRQEKPTRIDLTDVRYNAFHVDRINLDIASRPGSEGSMPDLLHWDVQDYQINKLQADVEETDLSKFLNWSMADTGIKEFSIDFHPGNVASIKGKFPFGAQIPFSGEITFSITPEKKLLLTFQKFKAVLPVPGSIQGMLIDKMLKVDPIPKDRQPNFDEAFNIRAGMKKLSNSQVLVDFTKMPTPVDLPLNKIETDEQGMRLGGGTGN